VISVPIYFWDEKIYNLHGLWYSSHQYSIFTSSSYHSNSSSDRRKYEVKRCREFNSWKGYIGILFLFIIDVLSFWLSTSVLLSWVMRAWWFFPIPNIPIRPAQLLTPTGGDAGALGKV